MKPVGLATWTLLCTLTWLVGCSQSADEPGQNTAAAVAPAGSPEEAVRQLEAAFKSADFEALKQIFAQPYGPLLVEWNQARELNAAQQQMVEVLRQQFPDQTQELASVQFDVAAQLKRLKSLVITDKQEQGDRVQLTVKSEVLAPDGENTISKVEQMIAIHQDGAWRLLPPFIEQQGLHWLKESIAEQHRVAGVLSSVAQQVADGQFQSMEEVELAVQNQLDTGAPQVSQQPAGGAETLRR